MMTLDEYLTPDPSLRDPLPSPELIPFAKKARASRTVTLHSKGAVRTIRRFNGFPTRPESELEDKIGLAFMARPDIKDLIDQPRPVNFYDDHGRLRSHTFDWGVVEICGTRTLTAVKYTEQVASSGIERIIDLIAEQLSPDVADYVVLVTEKKLTRTDSFNADLLYSVKSEVIPHDDAIVDALIRKLRGHTTIGELVKASGIDGSGFRAIARAIADRRLLLTTYRTIEPEAVVKRGRVKKR